MSEAAWMPTIAKGWKLARLKHVCRFAGGGTPDTGNPVYWQGEIPWVSPKDMKSAIITDAEDHISEEGLNASAAKLIEPGAVLIVMRSGILRHSIPVAINAVPVALNQDMKAMLPDSRLRSEFLARLIEGHQAELLREWRKEGATVESLESDLLGSTLIPVPPNDTQNAIVEHLDHETGRLDALIVAKERLIHLLAEKRQSLITCAVTRGLESICPLRQSHIEWLGDIPAHWRTERAKWLFKERDERSVSGNEELLSVSHLTGVTPRSEKDVNMFEAESTEGYKICHTGDLVINTLWAWMGAMGVSPCMGIVSPAYNVYEPGPEYNAEYVDALVRLPTFAQEVTRYSKGVWSSRLRLYPEGFFETVLPVPPLDEQKEIVEFIKSQSAKLVNLASATEHTTVLLRERRSALIAAAVTGQAVV